MSANNYFLLFLCMFFLDELEAILPSIDEHVRTLNEQSHHFAFDIIFVHFKRQLLTVPKMEVSSLNTLS